MWWCCCGSAVVVWLYVVVCGVLVAREWSQDQAPWVVHQNWCDTQPYNYCYTHIVTITSVLVLVLIR